MWSWSPVTAPTRCAPPPSGRRAHRGERAVPGGHVHVRAGGDGGQAADVLLLPVDTPLVRPETVGRLARAHAACRADVVQPAHLGRPGHPPLLGAALRTPILTTEPPGGLRELLAGYAADTLRVEVPDPGVALDADTPAHLERLAAAADGEDLPDEARCLSLLAEAGASEALVAHARAVATVAAALTAALNTRGQHLCAPLVDAAALFRDVARGEAAPRRGPRGPADAPRLHPSGARGRPAHASWTGGRRRRGARRVRRR